MGTLEFKQSSTIEGGTLNVSKGRLNLWGDFNATNTNIVSDTSTVLSVMASQGTLLSTSETITVGRLALNGHFLTLGSSNSGLKIQETIELLQQDEQLISANGRFEFVNGLVITNGRLYVNAEEASIVGNIRLNGGTLRIDHDLTFTNKLSISNSSNLELNASLIYEGLDSIPIEENALNIIGNGFFENAKPLILNKPSSTLRLANSQETGPRIQDIRIADNGNSNSGLLIQAPVATIDLLELDKSLEGTEGPTIQIGTNTLIMPALPELHANTLNLQGSGTLRFPNDVNFLSGKLNMGKNHLFLAQKLALSNGTILSEGGNLNIEGEFETTGGQLQSHGGNLNFKSKVTINGGAIQFSDGIITFHKESQLSNGILSIGNNGTWQLKNNFIHDGGQLTSLPDNATLETLDNPIIFRSLTGVSVGDLILNTDLLLELPTTHLTLGKKLTLDNSTGKLISQANVEFQSLILGNGGEFRMSKEGTIPGEIKGKIQLNGGMLTLNRQTRIYDDLQHLASSTIQIDGNIDYIGNKIRIGDYTLTIKGKGLFNNSNAFHLDQPLSSLELSGINEGEGPTVESIEIHHQETNEAVKGLIITGNTIINQLIQKSTSTISIADGIVLSLVEDFNLNQVDLTLDGAGQLDFQGGFTTHEATFNTGNVGIDLTKVDFGSGFIKSTGGMITFPADVVVTESSLELLGSELVLNGNFDVTESGLLVVNSDTSPELVSNLTLNADLRLTNTGPLSFGTLTLNNHRLTLGSAETDLTIANPVLLNNQDSSQIHTGGADLTLRGALLGQPLSEGNTTSPITAGQITSNNGTITLAGGMEVTDSQFQLSVPGSILKIEENASLPRNSLTFSNATTIDIHGSYDLTKVDLTPSTPSTTNQFYEEVNESDWPEVSDKLSLLQSEEEFKNLETLKEHLITQLHETLVGRYLVLIAEYANIPKQLKLSGSLTLEQGDSLQLDGFGELVVDQLTMDSGGIFGTKTANVTVENKFELNNSQDLPAKIISSGGHFFTEQYAGLNTANLEFTNSFMEFKGETVLKAGNLCIPSTIAKFSGETSVQGGVDFCSDENTVLGFKGKIDFDGAENPDSPTDPVFLGNLQLLGNLNLVRSSENGPINVALGRLDIGKWTLDIPNTVSLTLQESINLNKEGAHFDNSGSLIFEKNLDFPAGSTLTNKGGIVQLRDGGTLSGGLISVTSGGTLILGKTEASAPFIITEGTLSLIGKEGIAARRSISTKENRAESSAVLQLYTDFTIEQASLVWTDTALSIKKEVTIASDELLPVAALEVNGFDLFLDYSPLNNATNLVADTLTLSGGKILTQGNILHLKSDPQTYGDGAIDLRGSPASTLILEGEESVRVLQIEISSGSAPFLADTDTLFEITGRWNIFTNGLTLAQLGMRGNLNLNDNTNDLTVNQLVMDNTDSLTLPNGKSFTINTEFTLPTNTILTGNNGNLFVEDYLTINGGELNLDNSFLNLATDFEVNSGLVRGNTGNFKIDGDILVNGGDLDFRTISLVLGGEFTVNGGSIDGTSGSFVFPHNVTINGGDLDFTSSELDLGQPSLTTIDLTQTNTGTLTIENTKLTLLSNLEISNATTSRLSKLNLNGHTLSLMNESTDLIIEDENFSLRLPTENILTKDADLTLVHPFNLLNGELSSTNGTLRFQDEFTMTGGNFVLQDSSPPAEGTETPEVKNGCGLSSYDGFVSQVDSSSKAIFDKNLRMDNGNINVSQSVIRLENGGEINGGRIQIDEGQLLLTGNTRFFVEEEQEGQENLVMTNSLLASASAVDETSPKERASLIIQGEPNLSMIGGGVRFIELNGFGSLSTNNTDCFAADKDENNISGNRLSFQEEYGFNTHGVFINASDRQLIFQNVGDEQFFHIKLLSKPTSPVTVTLSWNSLYVLECHVEGQLAEGNPTFEFNGLNWNSTQEAKCTLLDGLLDSQDEKLKQEVRITPGVSLESRAEGDTPADPNYSGKSYEESIVLKNPKSPIGDGSGDKDYEPLFCPKSSAQVALWDEQYVNVGGRGIADGLQSKGCRLEYDWSIEGENIGAKLEFDVSPVGSFQAPEELFSDDDQRNKLELELDLEGTDIDSSLSTNVFFVPTSSISTEEGIRLVVPQGSSLITGTTITPKLFLGEESDSPSQGIQLSFNGISLVEVHDAGENVKVIVHNGTKHGILQLPKTSLIHLYKDGSIYAEYPHPEVFPPDTVFLRRIRVNVLNTFFKKIRRKGRNDDVATSSDPTDKERGWIYVEQVVPIVQEADELSRTINQRNSLIVTPLDSQVVIESAEYARIEHRIDAEVPKIVTSLIEGGQTTMTLNHQETTIAHSIVLTEDRFSLFEDNFLNRIVFPEKGGIGIINNPRFLEEVSRLELKEDNHGNDFLYSLIYFNGSSDSVFGYNNVVEIQKNNNSNEPKEDFIQASETRVNVAPKTISFFANDLSMRLLSPPVETDGRIRQFEIQAKREHQMRATIWEGYNDPQPTQMILPKVKHVRGTKLGGLSFKLAIDKRKKNDFKTSVVVGTKGIGEINHTELLKANDKKKFRDKIFSFLPGSELVFLQNIDNQTQAIDLKIPFSAIKQINSDNAEILTYTKDHLITLNHDPQGFFLGNQIQEGHKIPVYVSPSPQSNLLLNLQHILGEELTKLTIAEGNYPNLPTQLDNSAKVIEFFKDKRLVALPSVTKLELAELEKKLHFKQSSIAIYDGNQLIEQNFPREDTLISSESFQVFPGQGFYLNLIEKGPLERVRIFFKDTGSYHAVENLKNNEAEWKLLGVSDPTTIQSIMNAVNHPPFTVDEFHDIKVEGAINTSSPPPTKGNNSGYTTQWMVYGLYFQWGGVLLMGLIALRGILQLVLKEQQRNWEKAKGSLAVVGTLGILLSCADPEKRREFPKERPNHVHTIWFGSHEFTDNPLSFEWEVYSPVLEISNNIIDEPNYSSTVVNCNC